MSPTIGSVSEFSIRHPSHSIGLAMQGVISHSAGGEIYSV